MTAHRVVDEESSCVGAVGVVEQKSAHRVVEVAVRGVGDRAAGRGLKTDTESTWGIRRVKKKYAHFVPI